MQHSTKRRWIARGSIFGGAFLALVLGIAAAIFTGTAPITGGVDSAKFDPVWNSKPTVHNNGATCVASRDHDTGKVKLSVSRAYPGASCRMGGLVGFTEADRPDEDGVITGVDLALPQGWDAQVVEGCGSTVGRAAAGFGTGRHVEIEITMTAQASPGSNGTFAVGDGVKVAPVSQNAPLTCDPA